MKSWSSWLSVALALLLSAQRACAQGSDASAADVLFEDARNLMSHGEFTAACPKLVESQRLDPAPGTAVNLGDCYARLGKLADALQAMYDALELLRPGDDRISPVRQQIAALEKRTPRLIVRLDPAAPPGATVIRDGTELGTEDLGVSLPVNPGQHSIVLTLAGRVVDQQSVTLTEGANGEVVVGAGAANKHKEFASRMPEADRPTSSSRRTVGYALSGVGVAGLIFGAVNYVQFRSRESQRADVCPSSKNCTGADIAYDAELKDEANGSGRRAAIGIAGGAAALASGVVLLFLTSDGGGASARQTFRAAPSLAQGVYGLRIEGAW